MKWKLPLILITVKKKKGKEKKLILDIYAISLLRLAISQAFQYAGQAMGNWGTCILTSSIKKWEDFPYIAMEWFPGYIYLLGYVFHYIKKSRY